MSDHDKLNDLPSRRTVLLGAATSAGAIIATSEALRASTAVPPQAAGAGPAGLINVADEVTTPDLSQLPRVKQVLVAPPMLPAHEQVATDEPKIIEVTMTVEEKLVTIDPDNGGTIWAFTYNGSLPGPMIVCHEGDYVELTLVNPETNMLEHNIDFHASTGALGGGGLTHVLPGEEVVLRWKAIKPGVFVYHCAPGGEMIPYHVCHGMSGAVMVLPRDGLKDAAGNPLRYDQAVYIGEQEFYLPKDANGDYVQYESAGEDYSDSLDAMRGLIPTHVVFNGAVGALTGDNVITSAVGKTVLIIHAQANRDTRPHLIGGHGEYVWESGSFSDAPQTGFETWFIRDGSAGAAMYTFKQPGLYAYLNHNLIEAVLLGATAHFQVDGTWNNDLMEQVAKPRPIRA
ncbi:MAG: nitrite reductase, copper-containing [Limimaricola sp.]|uniref:copper-containing nitrite reductase n=1 Tax=Limimaricola sp. TaxID=2211665 RepID=UPI001DA60341|nr:copper-containing nitrite reductase [Limimaricola sp.]MBI1416707.1 nitrite reductase, copper-containing [Limimaricola sp.]